LPDTGDLFLNPFNKLSAHHRPMGAGRQKGIPAGYNSSNVLVTSAVPGSRGRLSVLGDCRCSTGPNFDKYHYRNSGAGSDRTITQYPGSSDDDLPITMRFPSGVLFPTNSGNDSNVGIFDDNDTDLYHLFFGFNGNTNEAKTLNIYPLSGLDYPGSDAYDRGSSASGLRWPSTVLQDFEINISNPVISHPLNAAVTRVAPAGVQVLSPYRCWPAQFVDGTAASNVGDIPYGALLFIDLETYEFLLANFTWTNKQKALLDCIYLYGIYIVDGSGTTTVSGGVTKAVMQVRVSQGFTSALRAECDVAFRRIYPYLWPMLNTRDYTTETELHTDSLPYRGTGGPIDYRSINTGYDA
jgi:hypothetical protein